MRPDVEWRLPELGRAGKSLDVAFALQQRNGTKIDRLSVSLVCETMADDGGLVVTTIAESVLETEEKHLPDGADYRATFAIPADALGTSALTGVTWWVCVQASIPWWPDLDARMPISIEGKRSSAATGVAIEPGPMQMTSDVVVPRPEGSPLELSASTSNGVTAEIALDDCAFAPGDEIRGQIALGMVNACDFYLLELAIGYRIEHHVQNGESYIEFITVCSLLSHARAVMEGRPMEVRGTLPRDLPTGRRHVMNVHLEYDAISENRYWAIDIGPYAPRVDPVLDLPAVGAARWRSAWTKIAEENGLALDDERLVLRGHMHERAVFVALNADRLRAEIAYSSLGLELAVERAEGIRFDKPDVQPDAFRNSFRVGARDEPQACTFLRGALARAMADIDSVQWMDDTRLVIETAGVVAIVEKSLRGFLRNLDAVCAALSTAIEEMPPPTGKDGALVSWRAFATAKRAKLTVSRLSIAGVRSDAGTFAYTTAFDDSGRTSGTTLTLSTERTLQGMAPPELVARWSKGTLRVDTHVVEVTFPEAVFDPASLDDTALALEDLANVLAVDGPHGPYR